jgi:hypothetical protein
MRKVFALVPLLFVVLAACGGGELGDECDEEGVQKGECSDGLVCGKKGATDGSLVCLKQCSAQTDCSGEEVCNGVGETSLKACRPALR